jgi:hypothetical protein
LFLHALDELGAFLHDGHVGGELVVPHVVETQGLEGRVHLAADVGAGGVAEALAQAVAHGGGGHGDDDGVRVTQLLEHFVHVGHARVDGAEGAVDQALAAVHARGGVDHLVDAVVVDGLDDAGGAHLVARAAGFALGGIDLDEEDVRRVDVFGRVALVENAFDLPHRSLLDWLNGRKIHRGHGWALGPATCHRQTSLERHVVARCGD